MSKTSMWGIFVLQPVLEKFPKNQKFIHRRVVEVPCELHHGVQWRTKTYVLIVKSLLMCGVQDV